MWKFLGGFSTYGYSVGDGEDGVEAFSWMRANWHVKCGKRWPSWCFLRGIQLEKIKVCLAISGCRECPFQAACLVVTTFGSVPR